MENLEDLSGRDIEKYPDTDGWNPDETFEEGRIWLDQYSPYAAVYCNETQKYTIVEIEAQEGHRRFQLQAIPELTEEEKAEAALWQAKVERAEKVANLTVEVDGMVFNADETSQDRIARVLAAAQTLGYEPETTTQLWVLADDTYANVTIAQLAKVLEKAGKAQTDVWVLPSYEPFKN